MLEFIEHVLKHSFEHTLEIIPFILFVYFILELFHAKLPNLQNKLKNADKMGPLAGAIIGCIPQCGFSVAASSLYGAGAIGAGTLIAVYLSTSDEAIPILLAHRDFLPYMIALIVCKIVIAVFFGYLLKYTVFKNERTVFETNTHLHSEGHDDHCSSCSHSHSGTFLSMLKCAVVHTLKTAVYLFISIAVIDAAVELIGESNLSSLLLKGSIFQPALAAVIGLIPGCSTSILLTELFISSNISFASAVAGLSSGAGFGFLVLFRELKDKLTAFKILLCVYLSAAVGGIIIQIISMILGI